MHAILISLILADGFPVALPAFPFIPLLDPPVIELDDPVHSEGYTAQVADYEATIDEWETPITEVNDVMGGWLGAGATQMPDATGGDFSTGIAPVDEVGSAYEFADWLGSSIGSLFQYMRTVVSLPGTVVGTLIIALIAVSGWLFFIRMLKYIMQIFDAGWSLARDIYTAIMDFIPL